MDSEWIKAIFTWVEANPSWTGFFIFLFAFGESLLLVGILLPGAAFLLALGTMIGLGVVELYPAWFWASLGAFLGDGISFWIGNRYQQRLLKMWPVYKFPELTAKGQQFFEKYGGISVFIGRFVGPIRPVIPAIGGMMNMNVKLYVIISLAASILWSPFYLLPGMLFGTAMDKMAEVAGKLAVLGLILLALTWLIYWLVSFLYRLFVPKAYNFLSRLLTWSQRHPLLGKLTSGLVDARKPEQGSLAMMAFLLIIFLVTTIILISSNQQMLNWNQSSDEFFYNFHNPWSILPMKWLLFLGHDMSLLLVTLVLSIWFIFRRLKLVLWHWLFVSFSSYLFSVLIARLDSGQWHWFAANHIFWLTCVSLFWAVLVAAAYPIKWRSWPYVVATIISAVYSFACLFFFQMSLSMVLISLLGAGVWAIAVGIAFRTRTRKQFLGMPVKLLFIGCLLTASTLTWLWRSQAIEINKPAWVLDKNADFSSGWLNKNDYRLDLQFINLPLENIRQQLTKQGWENEQIRTWGGLYQALVTEKTAAKWPIISNLHRGQTEALIMSKPLGEQLMVLHLWHDPKKTGKDWLGFISLNHKATTLWWFNYWSLQRQLNDKKILQADLITPGLVVDLIPSNNRLIVRKKYK